MKYIPRSHYMIVEQVKKETKILMPELESSETAGDLFKVITVGNDVDAVVPGDLVLIVGYVHTVSHGGKKFMLVKDDAILLTVREE